MDNALADIWHIREIVVRNHVARLHEAAYRWTNWISIAVHCKARFVDRRVKVHVSPARVVGRHVLLVTHSEIQRPPAPNLLVILEKETVVSRPQAAVGDTGSEDRLKNLARPEV